MSFRGGEIKGLNIAFDLDSTLFDLMTTFERILLEKYNDRVLADRCFQLKTEKDTPWPLLEEIFHLTYARSDELPMFPGVQELLHLLSEKSNGEPIRIITARPAVTSAIDTYKLCNRLGVPYEVIITGPDTISGCIQSASKFDYLRRYKYFVDDRRKTAIELSQLGIKVFMPKFCYNKLDKDYQGLTEIDSISDLIPMVDQFVEDI